MKTLASAIPAMRTQRLAAPLVACALLAFASPSPAQMFLPDGPEEFQGVDIIERRGEQVPLDTPLITAEGERVVLGDYFDGERPVVLVLAYYTCPMQCQLVMNASMDAFKKLNWDLGDEYRAINVSFDPRDTPEDAQQWRDDLYYGYTKAKDAPVDGDGWEFFNAAEEDSRAICDAVGFGYKYVPSAGDYSHPSAIIVLSPDGTVSNYLYGINYPEDQLKLALQDADDGKIGSLYDKVLFRCFLYDPNANSYVADAMLLMRISAGLTVALLSGGIGLLALQSRRKARRSDSLDTNTLPVGNADEQA